jgi:quinol monooxygenase YgiN
MLILSVSLRVPPAELDRLRPHIDELVKASRAEPGCQVYTYAEDMQDPGLLRVFEVYDDDAALEAHRQYPHFKAWRQMTNDFPRIERRLFDATLRPEG